MPSKRQEKRNNRTNIQVDIEDSQLHYQKDTGQKIKDSHVSFTDKLIDNMGKIITVSSFLTILTVAVVYILLMKNDLDKADEDIKNNKGLIDKNLVKISTISDGFIRSNNDIEHIKDDIKKIESLIQKTNLELDRYSNKQLRLEFIHNAQTVKK